MGSGVQISLMEDFDADSPLGRGVAQCWFDVSNAGGAVGFPSLPVDRSDVDAATQRLAREVSAGAAHLLVAECDEEVIGWVTLRLNVAPVARHWGSIERLQSHPTWRGRGIGRQLMDAATGHARSIGLEQLRLVLRSGEGLEAFYMKRGWVEIGRHPKALRISDGDDRDEVTMWLDLGPGQPSAVGR